MPKCVNPDCFDGFCSQSTDPSNMNMLQLARAYIVYQQLNCIYPPMEGLEKGTIFPELYRPFDKCSRDVEEEE